MVRRLLLITGFCLVLSLFIENSCYAFWIWTPKTKGAVNPKFAAKDSPGEQFDSAMRFYKENDFKRAAEEFAKLVEYYPDSDLAPEAQYYAGRSYEELGKYFFAYENYQKTIDNYPYTKRMEDIIKREYGIANIFQTKDVPKLMELELSESLDRAIMIYEKIVKNSPFGKYADRSLYDMAECYRRLLKYNEAAKAYERIINDYPDSELVPEAKYQFAYTMYEASLNPEYDQGNTNEALEEFKRISRTTPVPAIAEEAEKVVRELQSRKAASEFEVAEFYEKQKKYRSAIMYYRGIISKFPDTEAAKSAAERITYLKEKIKDV